MGIMKFFEYIAFFALSTSVNCGWYDYITSFGSSTPSPTVPTPSPTVPTEQIKRIAEFLQLHFRFIKELPDDQKNAFKEALNLKETNPDLIHKLQSVVELVDAEKTNQDKRSVDEKNLISKKDEIIKSHDNIYKHLQNPSQQNPTQTTPQSGSPTTQSPSQQNPTQTTPQGSPPTTQSPSSPQNPSSPQSGTTSSTGTDTAKVDDPFYKKSWFIASVICVLIAIIIGVGFYFFKKYS